MEVSQIYEFVNNATKEAIGDSAVLAENLSNIVDVGNIGVTTNQQMIEAERSLRMWNYFNSVYKDVDSV